MTLAAEAELEKAAKPLSRKIVFGFVALIVVFGLGIRLWGITWSLPDKRHPIATYHPDELINLNAARNADLLSGKLDIGFYNYGTFYFYLVNFAHIFGRGWGMISTTPTIPEGTTLSPTEELVRTAPENAGLFLAGRLVTALLGTATILAIFALGTRAFGDGVGFAAAMMYAFAPLAVVHAHFLTVDVPATFFVTMALLWAIRLLGTPTRKDFILAGVWVGLAAATKYNAGLVLIAPVVAAFQNRGTGDEARKFVPNLAILFGATVITFLIACPGVWLNWDVFWNGLPNYPGSGVRYELFEHSRSGHGEAFINTGPGWWYHLVVSLRYGLGGLLLLFCLGGVVAACMRRSRQDMVLLTFLILYYGLAGFSAVRFARYMLPIYPVLFVWAGHLMIGKDPDRPLISLPPLQKILMATGLMIISLTACTKTVMYVGAMDWHDPRDMVADELEKEAPQGASIAFAKIPWFFSPPLCPLFGAPNPTVRQQAAAQTSRFTLRISSSEWDKSVLEPAPDYVLLSDIESVHALERLKIPAAVEWVDALLMKYHARAVCMNPLPERLDPLFPEDLRYIMPTITVYTKRKTEEENR